MIRDELRRREPGVAFEVNARGQLERNGEVLVTIDPAVAEAAFTKLSSSDAAVAEELT